MLLIGGVTIGMMIFAPLSAVFPLMTYQHFGGDGYAASLGRGGLRRRHARGVGHPYRLGRRQASRGAHRRGSRDRGRSHRGCGFLPPDAFPAFIGLVAVMAVACAWFNGSTMTPPSATCPTIRWAAPWACSPPPWGWPPQ
ncbi:MAG: hypothetical protein ACLTDR_02915 [Adlercreutzia equolifaciens]